MTSVYTVQAPSYCSMVFALHGVVSVTEVSESRDDVAVERSVSECKNRDRDITYFFSSKPCIIWVSIELMLVWTALLNLPGLQRLSRP